jgi:L-threonylcarbamoyladenylate synthase
MLTEITEDIKVAAGFIRRGGVVAFPTETVYGLGANAFDAEAVAKIFAAKGRPADNPLIVHVNSEEGRGASGEFAGLAEGLNADAEKLIAEFFPGPLTLVLKRAKGVPDIVTAGLETVGIRMPRLKLAQMFLRECGVPVAAPSANISGRPSPTTWQAVRDDLDGRIDCILKGKITEIGLESTVVDCTGKFPVVLRHGAVTLEMLRSIIPETSDAADIRTEKPRSPGQKHKHYSPKALVKLVDIFDGSEPLENSAFIGVSEPAGNFELKKIAADVNEYAAALFEFFRECDRRNIAIIYCESVTEEGIGVALMDRIKRAATGVASIPACEPW